MTELKMRTLCIGDLLRNNVLHILLCLGAIFFQNSLSAIDRLREPKSSFVVLFRLKILM